jgi:tRNA (cmo5U34)-methyltransferase
VTEEKTPGTSIAKTEISDRFKVPGSWQFTPEVVDGFDDHVQSSVPLYDDIQALVCGLSDWLAPRGSIIADLGASTGTTAQFIASRHPERRLTFHLYDSQPSMLEAARLKLSDVAAKLYYHDARIEDGLVHSDASLTLALFTLQFLDPADRVTVLRSARERSRPHGALIIAEKLRLADTRWQEMAISSSHDYKTACGISSTAICDKERALRGVLMPLADSQQRSMLGESGWTSVETLFRWHQWAVYAAFASSCC